MKRILVACIMAVSMFIVSCGLTQSGGTKKILSMEDEYFFRNAEGLPLGDVDSGCPYKVNYRTGVITPVCVDPLCGHDQDSGCAFFNAAQCVPSENMMFFIRGEMSVDANTGESSGRVSLCAYDMLNGVTKELGTFEETLSIIAAAENRVYFSRLIPDSDKTASYHFYFADGVSGKIREMPMKGEYNSDNTDSSKFPEIFAADGKKLYWYGAAEGGMEFWTTDLNGKKRSELDLHIPQAMNGQFSDGYSYYKIKSEQSVKADDVYKRLLSGNINELWRVRLDGGEPEKLADDVAQFIVSGGKIYYTKAEKAPETITVHGDTYYDLIGGKIYRMNIDGSDAELIADTDYDFAYLYGVFGGTLDAGEDTYIAMLFSELTKSDFYNDGYDYIVSPDTLIFEVSGKNFLKCEMPDGR